MNKDLKEGDRVYRLADGGGHRLTVFGTDKPLTGTVKHIYPGSVFVEWDTCKGTEMWHSFSQVEKA